MKICELLEKRPKGIFEDDCILKQDLIAFDGRDNKILFDTRKNKREYVSKYMNAEVIALWADVRPSANLAYGKIFIPVIKCYIEHNSWIDKESD